MSACTTIFSAAFSPSGAQFACGADTGDVRILSAAQSRAFNMGAQSRVYALAFTDETVLAAGGDHGVALVCTASSSIKHLALPDAQTQVRQSNCNRVELRGIEPASRRFADFFLIYYHSLTHIYADAERRTPHGRRDECTGI